MKNTFRKKNGGKASNLASAVAETVCPPCIRGPHHQLDYLTRPKNLVGRLTKLSAFHKHTAELQTPYFQLLSNCAALEVAPAEC